MYYTIIDSILFLSVILVFMVTEDYLICHRVKLEPSDTSLVPIANNIRNKEILHLRGKTSESKNIYEHALFSYLKM